MKLSSRWGLVLSYTGLILIFAAIILLSSTLSSRRTLLSHAHDIMTNIAAFTIDKSSNYLIPAGDAARLTLGLSKNNILSSNDSSVMESYFYEQLFINPQFSGIYYGTVNGEFIMASRYNKQERGGFYTKIISHLDKVRKVELINRDAKFQVTQRRFSYDDNYDPRKRPWFQEAVKAKELIWTTPYVFFTSQKPGITTANPVYAQNGALRGVIGVDIALDELSTFLSTLTVGQHGLAFIMDQFGAIVAYPDMTKLRQPSGDKFRLTNISELDDDIARLAYESLEIEDNSFALNEPVFTSFSSKGKKFHAMFAPFSDPQWPWIIGIYLPEDDYLGTLKKNALFNIGISMVAILLAGFFGLAVARRLDTARLAAEAADKAKSHFLASMSHEIRTPMNALLGAGELMQETKLTDEQKRYLKLFRNAGNVLHELINDVLDLAKVESGEFTITNAPFNLREIIKETCSVLSNNAREKGLEFSCAVDPNTPDQLIGASARIKQVLVNLIGNAIKFTDTGKIKVFVAPYGPQLNDAVTLEFTVKDTGIGIPPIMQKAVFDSFIQVNNSTGAGVGGTGLGLAICRNLVTLMGGTIELSSEEAKGSTFRFTLSFKKSTGTLPATKPNANRGEKRSLRILLVDDDQSVRLILEMFTKGRNDSLTLAVNGKNALELCERETFDLVFMDLEMPVMDGYESTLKIRELERKRGLPPVPVVALTSHSAIDLEKMGRDAGFTEHVTKPIRKSDLIDILDRYALA